MDTKEKAFAWVDAHRDDMVDLWREMVSIDSGIGVKEGGMEIGNLCASRLEKMGFSIRRYSFEKCGDTIIGERGDLSKPYVILMGHMDTVFYQGEVEKRPFTIKDGKAYGPGVLDMKGTTRKVIFQGVHQLMGSDLGPEWTGDEKRESRMVFIGIDLPQDIFKQGLDQCLV